jgi:hypothetical protein
MAIDEAKLNEFMANFVRDMGAVAHAATVVVGDQLGLYKALANDPLTSSQKPPAPTRATCANGCARRPRAATRTTTPRRSVFH